MAILTGHARGAGIIGWPVAHSRSPRLHGYWLEKYGIDGAYIPLPIAPDGTVFVHVFHAQIAVGPDGTVRGGDQ